MQSLPLSPRRSIPPLSEPHTQKQNVPRLKGHPLRFSTRDEVAGGYGMGSTGVVREGLLPVISVEPDEVQEDSAADDTVLSPICV